MIVLGIFVMLVATLVVFIAVSGKWGLVVFAVGVTGVITYCVVGPASQSRVEPVVHEYVLEQQGGDYTLEIDSRTFVFTDGGAIIPVDQDTVTAVEGPPRLTVVEWWLQPDLLVPWGALVKTESTLSLPEN